MRQQEETAMTAIHMVTSARPHLPSYRGTAHRRLDPGLLIAAALFIGVFIAGAVFTVLAARTIPDIGAIYVPVP
jgi:hypothetical protein